MTAATAATAAISRRLRPRAALTRHALPAHDPSIVALDPADRAIAEEIWAGRAEAELRASGSFAYVAGVLAEAGAPAELVALARRAIHDERRHARICWQVASAFAGHERPAPRVLQVTVPRHDGASPALRRVLHVAGMCCLNETSGNAFLEVCRAGARGALVRTALHELACDEIDHARLGWAFVASPAVDAATRAELAAWLPELLAENAAAWRRRLLRPIGDALVAQGCPRAEDVDAAIAAAGSKLIVPGFARLGIAAQGAGAAPVTSSASCGETCASIVASLSLL